jgi:hypothetical protein
MEGKHRTGKRTLCRLHEVSRLEGDLWELVYEQLWPRTIPKTKAKKVKVEFARDCPPSRTCPRIAKGA